ncbi:unnamed protein product [Dicrocoelium dendriticum]|nr:unnamed protein product [Dicrocoelium dendriticum]
MIAPVPTSLWAFILFLVAFASDEPRVVVMRDLFGADGDDRSASSVNPVPSAKRSGMQLGARGGAGAVDQFVDRLKAEGEAVSDDLTALLDKPASTLAGKSTGVRSRPDHKPEKKEDLHLRIEEKLTIQVGRDGGLEHLELQGIMHALALSSSTIEARVRVDTLEALSPRNEHQPAAQLQTHPNMDKKVFVSTSWLQIKSGGKALPVEQEVGVLRWRLQTQDESVLSITFNCWPNEIRGGFEVNIEYELQNTELELCDAVVNVPLPSGSKSPSVGNYDGEYEVNAKKTQLSWILPLINASNTSGSIEFTVGTESTATADQFFPLTLSFSTDKSFCGIRVTEATNSDGNPIPFSSETRLYTEKFEVV